MRQAVNENIQAERGVALDLPTTFARLKMMSWDTMFTVQSVHFFVAHETKELEEFEDIVKRLPGNYNGL